MQEILKLVIFSSIAGLLSGGAMVFQHKTLHPQKQHPVVNYIAGTVTWFAPASAIALYSGMEWQYLLPFVIVLALSGLATVISYLIDLKGLEIVLSKVNKKNG
jgi:uncharacterized protein YceK